MVGTITTKEWALADGEACVCVQPEFMHCDCDMGRRILCRCLRAEGNKMHSREIYLSDHAFPLKPSMAPLPKEERLCFGIQHSSSFMTCLTSRFCLSYSCYISTQLPLSLPHSGAATSTA